MNAAKNRLALVIGAGSVKCAAALGVQSALQQAGISIDMVVGCSGGSMYAALIALGYEAKAAAELPMRLWTEDVTAKASRRAMLQALLPKLFGFGENFGLRDDRLVWERLNKAFGGRSFEEARIPLYITATDFSTGEQVTLSQGSLVDAIRASISIPLIFPPWKVDGRQLVDGYLSDPLPVDVAIKEGADIIVAVGFDSPYQSRVNSLMRFNFQISSIMTNNLLRSNFAFHNLAHHSEVLLILPQFEDRIRLFDTGKIPAIIEAGEKAMREQLPYLERLLKGMG